LGTSGRFFGTSGFPLASGLAEPTGGARDRRARWTNATLGGVYFGGDPDRDAVDGAESAKPAAFDAATGGFVPSVGRAA
jgi:hypothetical protein